MLIMTRDTTRGAARAQFPGRQGMTYLLIAAAGLAAALILAWLA